MDSTNCCECLHKSTPDTKYSGIIYKYVFSTGKCAYSCSKIKHMDDILSTMKLDETISIYKSYNGMCPDFIEHKIVDCYSCVFNSKLFYGPYTQKQTYLRYYKYYSIRYHKEVYKHQSLFANIIDVINEKVNKMEKLLEMSLNNITDGYEYDALLHRANELTEIIRNHSIHSEITKNLHLLFLYYKGKYESLHTIELPSCNSNEMLECSICFEEIDKNNSGGYIDCGHTFHNQCLQKWIAVKHNCPNCRKELDLSKYL